MGKVLCEVGSSNAIDVIVAVADNWYRALEVFGNFKVGDRVE